MALEKIRGIVTDILKHSDRHNIVTVFSRDHGRVALLSAAGNGKSARIRNASLMPLSVISADINFNAGRELQFLGRFQRDILWKDIYFNPVKSSISLFISEFLNNYIRNSGADPRLWEFIIRAIEALDRAKSGLGNFHLAFLIEFMEYAGIRPDMTEWRPDGWFDMRGGAMTILPPMHNDVLAPDEVAILLSLGRLNIRSFRVFRMNASQRRELLKGILKYYGLHFPGINNLKSPEILAEVFGK